MECAGMRTVAGCHFSRMECMNVLGCSFTGESEGSKLIDVGMRDQVL
jgi:hypothetical protein